MNEWNLLSLLSSKPGICSKVFQLLSPAPTHQKKEKEKEKKKASPQKGHFSLIGYIGCFFLKTEKTHLGASIF